MWKRGLEQPSKYKKKNNKNREWYNNKNREIKKKEHINDMYKTDLCERYENDGQCKYGDKCQYAHGKHELREKPDIVKPSAYKTVLCNKYWNEGSCPYGKKCRFVHEKATGFDQNKLIKTMTHKKYKTKECENFKNGYCPYGDKCGFIHTPNIKRSESEEYEQEILNKVNFNDTKIKLDNNGNVDYLSMFMYENLSTDMLKYSDNKESKFMKLMNVTQ